MDVTSFWVLAVVVILGGVIALGADRLGRNLGKKRLRIGNLRPRRTAEVIVFSAGMITPLLAILVIMAISAEAREWIIGGREAVKQAKLNIEARDRAVKQYRQTLVEVRSLEVRLKDLEKTVQTAKSQTEKSLAEAQKSQERAKGAESKVASLDKSVRNLSGEVRQRQKTLSQVQQDLTQSRKTLQSYQLSYKVAEKQKKEAEDKVGQLLTNVGDLEERIKSGQGNLVSLRNDLEAKKKELEQAESARKTAVAALNSELEALNGQLANANFQITRAQTTLRELAANWLYEPITFRVNDEVARLSIPRQQSAGEAQRALNQLLSQASIEAADRGAKVSPTGREADIFDQTSSSGAPITADQIRAELLRKMTGQGSEIVLIARAQVNSFRGQPVPMIVSALPNPVVFKEGEVLGDTKIDGTIGVGRIFERIGELLRVQVRKRAEDAQMIPVNGREDAYGKIEPEEIFNAITSIQNLGRNVRVQILAKNETRAGGPLELEFRLK